MGTKPTAEKFSMNQNVHSSEVQPVESDANRIQGLDSQTHHQSRIELTDSQSSHSQALQQQQKLTMNQGANSISRDVSGLSSSQVTNSRKYCPLDDRSSERQDLLLQSISPSWIRSRDLQNLQPQRLQRHGRGQNLARNSQPRFSYAEVCQLQSTKRSIPNQLTVYPNSRPRNQQPPETEELGIQRLHPQSQNLAQSNHGKLHLVSQRVQKHSQSESVATFHSKINKESNKLPGKVSAIGFVTNRNQNAIPIATINYSDLEQLRCSNANRPEEINILVHGPLNWTNNLLQTFKRGLPTNFVPPHTLAHRTNIIRCGVPTSVSIWQSDNLIKSTDLFRSHCTSTKSTVVLVNNFVERIEMFLFTAPQIDRIRININHFVPIILVGCKMSTGISSDVQDIQNRSQMVRSIGFKMKAQMNLSAFLDCSVDLVSDVDNVFSTAIDVSQLNIAKKFIT